MKEMDQYTYSDDMELKLWEYIDGHALPGEKLATEQLIAGDPLWRAKYNELLAVNRSLDMSSLEEPSMRFTKNVMDEIGKYQIAPATKEYINKKIIWSIGGFFIICILSFLVYSFSQISWSESGDNSVLKLDLKKEAYRGIFSNTSMNILLMLNAVVAVFLLDRYLSHRKKQDSQTSR